VTSLPDWLVERAALDEVAPASRERLERADPRDLAERIAALRDANAAELAAYPPGPALAQIQARLARPRPRRVGWLAIAAAATLLVLVFARRTSQTEQEVTRVKGSPRLLAFRQAGDQAERLDADAVVRAGDLIQLRYNAGGQSYGLIASVDGAGTVTLHFPLSEDAPPEATAVAPETTTLPHAYALDDAPHFERFFFITANEPIDVAQGLAALRAFAHRDDSASAALDLPPGQHQWSLRLRKGSP
jgi:hypothetical protein